MVNEVDRSIEQAMNQFVERGPGGPDRVPTRGLLEVYSVRVLDADGTIVATSFPDGVAVDDDAASVIGQSQAVARSTVAADGTDFRVHTVGLPDGALQIARPLDEVESVLDDLRRRTLLLVVAVSLAAALAGWMIAGTVTAPVRRLTKAAEDVGSSGRLDVEVPGTGTDEVGRLGGAFRYMLGRARRVPSGAAATRAGRRPRTADTAHESQDEPLGAAAPPRHADRRCATACWTISTARSRS